MRTIDGAGRAACLLAAVAGLGLGGCAATGAPNADEVVRERAQERLDLMLAEDYTAAYAYLSPGYRSSVTSAAYLKAMALRPVRWTGARVAGTECTEDACEVRVAIDYAVYGAVPGVSRFDGKSAATEDWIRVDGEWYLRPSG